MQPILLLRWETSSEMTYVELALGQQELYILNLDSVSFRHLLLGSWVWVVTRYQTLSCFLFGKWGTLKQWQQQLIHLSPETICLSCFLAYTPVSSDRSWCHTPHHCFLWLTFVSCLFIVLPLQLDCKHLAFLERLKLYYFFYSPCLVHGRTQGIQTGEFQFALSCLSKHVLLWGRESSEVALFPSKLAIGRLGLNK